MNNTALQLTATHCFDPKRWPVQVRKKIWSSIQRKLAYCFTPVLAHKYRNKQNQITKTKPRSPSYTINPKGYIRLIKSYKNLTAINSLASICKSYVRLSRGREERGEKGRTPTPSEREWTAQLRSYAPTHLRTYAKNFVYRRKIIFPLI